MISAAPLDWFPKPRQPGDLDGHGALRLLGQPSLDPTEILVRETAQNSWDARLGSGPVHYSLDVRSLNTLQLRTLRQFIVTGEVPGTELSAYLRLPTLAAVEITDRNTIGLAGPIRNDLPVGASTPTNFIDFVFNVGVPSKRPLSGGTYGFGRTIAYQLSHVGTIVVFSRTVDLDGRPSSRLIASASADPFVQDGRQYTGRHWWGRTVKDERAIKPVTGVDAEELAGLLFSSPPDATERGTSILILAPDMGDLDIRSYAQRLAEAALWHLWPKLAPYEPAKPLMTLEVRCDGERLPIDDPSEHPILSGHVSALNAVRAIQRGEEPSTRHPTKVVEIQRYTETVGHLGLALFSEGTTTVPPAGETNAESPIGLSSPSRHVALMRHRAELVVNYKVFDTHPSPSRQWAGVFKPQEQYDSAFAAAEPPAHDAWEPSSVRDKRQRSRVKVSLHRIAQAVKAHISPPAPQSESETTASGAKLGDALGGLTLDSLGTGPNASPASSTTGGSPQRPKRRTPTVSRSKPPEPTPDGWVAHELGVFLPRPTISAELDTVVKVAYDGGSERDDQLVRNVYFSPVGETDSLPQPPPMPVSPGDPTEWILRLEVHRDVAVDVSVKYVELE